MSQKINFILLDYCCFTDRIRIFCSLFLSWRRQHCLCPWLGTSSNCNSRMLKMIKCIFLKMFIGRHLEMIDTFLNKVEYIKMMTLLPNHIYVYALRNFSQMLLMVIHVLKRYTFLGILEEWFSNGVHLIVKIMTATWERLQTPSWSWIKIYNNNPLDRF